VGMARLCLAFSLLAAALGAFAITAAGRADRVALSSGWPKVNHLRDGSTVSVWRNGRVVERGRGGRVHLIRTAGAMRGTSGGFASWAAFAQLC
jgi:hypothetical protein